jgi:hypothetical protein
VATNLTALQKEFAVHDEMLSLPEGINSKAPVRVEILESLGRTLVADVYPDEYPVILCECKLEGDLFSSFDDKAAVITTQGWTRKLSTHSVQKYILFTLSDVLMNFYADTPIHYETRGCLGDYCDNKKDINVGLTKCEYCSECQRQILKAVANKSITPNQFAAIYKVLDFAAERRICFVLMPFAKEFNPVYDLSIKQNLARKKWLCERADKIFQPGDILSLVWQQVLRADLIVADLTGRNPNVFYELGYADALHKYTVLITQSIEDVPFDLRQRQMIKYKPSSEGLKALARSLKEYL